MWFFVFSRGCSVATPSHVNIFKEEHRSQVTSDSIHQGTSLWGHCSLFGPPFFKFAFFRVFHVDVLYLCHFHPLHLPALTSPVFHPLSSSLPLLRAITGTRKYRHLFLKKNSMSPLSVTYMNMCLGLTTWDWIT